ncbi:hypothetical protein HPB48_020016 [Haemaphysalis longicornis]|uniref:Uncharacterized protein n=1 Tax=Haemaphysalis longicornis TaxID=44386 RepID=A0A9J6H4Z4_HAELO|nr:hypothetical protein HPB48_020016 [Haemaphysalis longicornis]
MGELVHRRKARPRHVGPALRQYVLSGPPTGKFIVNLEYNAFRVEADLYEDDVPPGRIKDLTATPKANLSADDRPILTFQWTCGGNHGYDGTAAAFELRGAEDTNDLLTGFHNAPLVDAKSDVVKGSLTPRPAFTVQEAEVAVPYALLKEAVIAGKDATELHFSIRSKSSKNIYSMVLAPIKIGFVSIPLFEVHLY